MPRSTTVWPTCSAPALTTVYQPSATIGARAVQLLLRRMTDPQPAASRRNHAPRILRLHSPHLKPVEQSEPPAGRPSLRP
ncbi:substrate-binding domain-containing protein [Kribbella caucasensis]|uniref:substrate-binding domain-containing protein n=1 Tax=Kribbella caucasensis TaxID=2512215 RepID=UPI001414EB80